jgi:ribosome-associated translation inhibitor RaiA
MEIIQFKGVSDLSEEEKGVVNTLSTEYYQKIKRELKNITSIELHVKTYKKEGGRKKYSIHLKVIAPTRILESEEDDWDLARTLHRVYKNMENQIRKAYRTDTSYKKPYG